MNKFKVEEEGDYIDDYLDLYNSHINSLTKQLDDKEVVNALSHQSVSQWIAMIFVTQTTNRKTIDQKRTINDDSRKDDKIFGICTLTLKRHSDDDLFILHRMTNYLISFN